MSDYISKNTETIQLGKNEIHVFVENFIKGKYDFKKHLIVQLVGEDVFTAEDLVSFVEVSLKHQQENKKSVVLQCQEFDYDKVPNQISFAPTLPEAYDVIEMEEIERDLGF